MSRPHELAEPMSMNAIVRGEWAYVVSPTGPFTSREGFGSLRIVFPAGDHATELRVVAGTYAEYDNVTLEYVGPLPGAIRAISKKSPLPWGSSSWAVGTPWSQNRFRASQRAWENPRLRWGTTARSWEPVAGLGAE